MPGNQLLLWEVHWELWRCLWRTMASLPTTPFTLTPIPHSISGSEKQVCWKRGLFKNVDFLEIQTSVSRRGGGRDKGGRKQTRANANKRRQTSTNASKRRGENASKRKQTRANVDRRKQTLTPPFIAVSYTRLCNPLKKRIYWAGSSDIF